MRSTGSRWAPPVRWRALAWPHSLRSLETTARFPTATTAMTMWRCTSRARSAGKACRSAATTMPTTWEAPALTVPIRGTISPDSTPSPATRTISPTTSCIIRSISRRAFARRRSPVSSWKTAGTPAPTGSVTRRICAGSSRRAALSAWRAGTRRRSASAWRARKSRTLTSATITSMLFRYAAMTRASIGRIVSGLAAGSTSMPACAARSSARRPFRRIRRMAGRHSRPTRWPRSTPNWRQLTCEAARGCIARSVRGFARPPGWNSRSPTIRR